MVKMSFFFKNNGAISVFLVIVLVPVLLIAGVTTDAARIYTSKIVISDAGEMALNAGLSQYETSLHDKYGFLVMENTPEAMNDALLSFFNASLNGTGILEDYDQTLHLMTESFNAVNIEASNICKTEVEKQQIIEYMKYRAPVCLTELVLEKFDQFKGTKKMTEAMEKEMDFAEAMEECQDSIEEAKEALDALDSNLNSFPDQTNLQKTLDCIQEYYKNDLSKALLMLSTVQNYTQKSSETNLRSLVDSYIYASKKVNLSAPIDRISFESYIDCLYYDNAIIALGGINKLKNTDTNSESSTDDNTNEALISDYQAAKKSISTYPSKLREKANDIISDAYNLLNGYYNQAVTLKSQSETAYDKLLVVKENFDFAQQKWDEWSTATSALDDGETKTSMQKEVDNYKEFFDTGAGSDDANNLDILLAKLKEDKDYFYEISSILTEEKFFDKIIARVSISNQYSEYYSQAQTYAKKYITSSKTVYSTEEGVRTDYAANYVHITIKTTNLMYRIHEDEFYKKIQEYTANISEDSENTKSEVDRDIKEGADSAADVTKDDDTFPDFDWSTVSGQLISSGGKDSADSNMTDIGGSVNSSSSRKNLLAKYRQALQSASSFLNAVDQILAKNLENLYIAEYAMQMFSCYTSNKDSDGNTISDEEIVSLSGYKLSENKAYRSETEYVLWGDTSSKNNVKNTILMIFGIRFLFNSIFAFTNSVIKTNALYYANLIAGTTPYLVPIVKVIIQFLRAAIETADDVVKIKDGKGVTIIKTDSSWKTYRIGIKAGDNTSGLTFNYQEYLRIFLNISMISGNENKILGRIADCVQVNTPNYDLKKGYTMLGIRATIQTNTNFIGSLSNWAGQGTNSLGNYKISYNSVLGY